MNTESNMKNLTFFLLIMFSAFSDLFGLKGIATNSFIMIDSTQQVNSKLKSTPQLVLIKKSNRKAFNYGINSKIKLEYFDEMGSKLKASGKIQSIDSAQVLIVNRSLFTKKIEQYAVPLNKVHQITRKPLSVQILFPVSLTGPLVDVIIPLASGLAVGAPSPYGIVTIGMAIYTIVMPSKRVIGDKYSISVKE